MPDTTAVILSGGSGTRLWPLSRTRFPKQFIPLMGGRSLFAGALEQARRLGCARVIVVCNEAHRFFAVAELRAAGVRDGRVLIEPVARNTAPATALAALALEECGGGPMLVLPSDHCIADRAGAAPFADCVARARAAAARGLLVTFGIKPGWAETGYGYIIAGEALADGVCKVAQFTEKPGLAQARDYAARRDCYWNSGMFLFEAKSVLAELRRHAPEVLETCAEAWQRRESDRILGAPVERVEGGRFAACPDISLDYALMEKTAGAAVVPADIEWSDLGSWEAFAQIIGRDAGGNAVVGDAVLENCRDNMVYASGRLVAAVGVRDHVIVETPDAVLVADRAHSQSVRQLVERLRERRRPEGDWHRKVRRPWGSYESVDSGEGFQVKRIIVEPGQCLSLQRHRRRSEHWVVVRGEARVTLGDEVLALGPNRSVCIPVGVKHRLENPGDKPLHLIEVQCGDYLGEDDIERFEDVYGRTGKS